MGRFDIDISCLKKIVDNKEIDKMPVSGNEARMKKVAFDLFRVDGDPKESLWVVQADDDGNEFLVRTYESPSEDEIKTASPWSVAGDAKCANMTVYYSNIPIYRIAAADYGVQQSDAEQFRSFIYNKLSSDNNFVRDLLSELPISKLTALAESFPQLAETYGEPRWSEIKPIDMVLNRAKKRMMGPNWSNLSAVDSRWGCPKGCDKTDPIKILNSEGVVVGLFSPAQAPELQLHKEQDLDVECLGCGHKGKASEFTSK